MKICIPIKEKNPELVKERLLEAAKRADLAEIWLDQIKDPDLKDLLFKAPLPILVACKRKVEQGNFTGSYEDQAQLLIEAIRQGAKYVDIPLFMPNDMNKKIVQSARAKAVKVIISHHDFTQAPGYEDMCDLADKMKAKGADVVKLAVSPKDMEETVQVISVAKYLQGKKIPHIVIGMGTAGRLTRILTPTLGGEMMFAVLDKKGQTAQGQMTAEELREAWKLIKAK